MVVAVLAITTVPLVKKAKLIMDDGQIKNSWAAMWVDDQLVVVKNGTAYTQAQSPSDFVDSSTARFVPPSDGENFNVTVIGGGGGGGAGVSLPGFAKYFFASNNGDSHTYTAPFSGRYRIVAIGGGGGGGGAQITCGSNSGHSAAGVVALADLEKNDELAVIVGSGGARGKGKTFGDTVSGLIIPIVSIAAIAAISYFAPAVFPAIAESLGMTLTAAAPTALVSQGYAWTFAGIMEVGCIGSTITGVASSMVIPSAVAGVKIASAAALSTIASEVLAPSNDPAKGGGHGLSTVIYGGGDFVNDGYHEARVNIIAGGGAGGKYKRIKWFSCKSKGRGDIDNDFPTTVGGTDIVKSYIIEPNHDSRFFCYDSEKKSVLDRKNCDKIHANISGGLSEATTFGDGGQGGPNGHNGKAGSDGYAEITEVSAFGGGGGQAGSVSSHTFPKLRPEAISVVVGKGGKGGTPSTSAGLVSEGQQRGQDGSFSSFGSKIIASGGEGGEIRIVAPEQDSTMDNFVAAGEDGLRPAVMEKLLKKAGLASGVSIYKGVKEADGDGAQTSKGYPGLGGAGGGAKAGLSSSINTPYLGGDGSSGAVIVTWK